MTLFKDKFVNAAKGHICDWCGEDILSGERHKYLVGKWEGDFFTSRWHEECDKGYADYEYQEDGYENRGMVRGKGAHPDDD